MLGIYAQQMYRFTWLCRLCIIICGLLVFIVAKMIILPSLRIVSTHFQRFTNECVGTPDSRLYLLLQARVIIGLKRISRMSYTELLQLHNSHAPLLDLEAKRRVLSSHKLCKRLREASLHELSDLYDASEIITRNVEHVLSQTPKYVKLQQRWGKTMGKYYQGSFEQHTIEKFQLVLLVLSLFESTNEDSRTVILYGVPGLPSLTLSASATYAEVRSIIFRRAPRYSEFYFVAHGRIITIEDTIVDWGCGHLVLNVHSCRDLPGGSMRGSSDDERKGRKRSKRINLQELLRSDSSIDEDFDDTTSVGISESDYYQDSDSSWDLEKEKKRAQKRRDSKKNRGTKRTAHQLAVQKKCF